MDMQRAFLAILLSFLILTGYQYFFVPAQPSPPVAVQQQKEIPASVQPETKTIQPTAAPSVAVNPSARSIVVETALYKAVFFEQGGGLKSFRLKKYRTGQPEDSPPVELVTASSPADLPMTLFLEGVEGLPLFKADKESVRLDQGGELRMHAELASGLRIERKLAFRADSYLVGSSYTITNVGSAPVQVRPVMSMTNAPFASGSSSANSLFSGPAAFVGGALHEVPAKELDDGPRILQGTVDWTAHMDNYFMCALLPEKSGGAGTVSISLADEKSVRITLADGTATLAPGASADFRYEGYFGPKKLAYLKQVGYNLQSAINLGWFDVIAKPMLLLLNFFYSVFGNYGVAIILLTCLIKGAFWPITHKGMKSMRNMQKIQPKIAKLREKHKDDPAKMNQEMMTLYKTYKINPLGGCLPMFIQIPFFFALYRVLMAAIELRHAPFMLWINDLSAPDRLMIGFDIPVLHGIPVLTVLMGATMFLQQKMTPTTADPAQAKIMQLLPVVFTVMFVNFASGLVLYWFVNNLLSILQQQLINRQAGQTTSN